MSTKFGKVGEESLKNSGLKGVWKMQEGYWGGESRFGEGKYKGFSMVKIFAYLYAVYAYYDSVNKKFDGRGVVRYQYDGKTLTDLTRKGTCIEFFRLIKTWTPSA